MEAFESWLKKNSKKIPKYMRDTQGGRDSLYLIWQAAAAIKDKKIDDITTTLEKVIEEQKNTIVGNKVYYDKRIAELEATVNTLAQKSINDTQVYEQRIDDAIDKTAEECAKIAETLHSCYPQGVSEYSDGKADVIDQIAAAIRERFKLSS